MWGWSPPLVGSFGHEVSKAALAAAARSGESMSAQAPTVSMARGPEGHNAQAQG